MLTLTCTKCGATLEVDDGFAGGACRCQACGTIQTVPGRDATVIARLRGGQRLFERSGDVAAASIVPAPDPVGGPAPTGANLLDPARPRPPRAARPPKVAGPVRRAWPATLLVAITGTVAVAMAILLMRRLEHVSSVPTEATDPAVPVTRRSAPAASLTSGPRFGPIRLDGAGPIVYLIDRDETTNVPFTPALHEAVHASIDTLPPDRLATVRYFAADDGSPTFDASSKNRAGLTAWMGNVTTRPSTDVIASLAAAVEASPTEVVLITGRGWRLDASFSDRAAAVVRGRRTRVHTVSLGTADATGPLATLAAITGGEAVAMTVEDVARLAGGRAATTTDAAVGRP